MGKINAVIIASDGTIAPFEYEDDIQALQDAVGGTFGLVTSSTGETSFWMNDDGKLIGLPPNKTATKLWWRLNPRFDGLDFLVGDVVITGGADEDGNTLSIGDEALDALNLGGLK